MKVILKLVAMVLAVDAIEDELWKSFKKNYSKTYSSELEEQHRYIIFLENIRSIRTHNSEYKTGDSSYFMTINQFADMTPEEFESTYLGYVRPQFTRAIMRFKLEEGVEVPDAIDWRERGIGVTIKHQGRCASCWALALTGVLEAHNEIKHNISLPLSDQELIDCANAAHGCSPGRFLRAFNYVKKNGISTQRSYPYNAAYHGQASDCHKGENSGIKVIELVTVLGNEEVLKQAVGTVGPVAVAINGKGISLYGGNVIFDNSSCSHDLNHWVLAVGYGTDRDGDFWILKNSWGPKWGDKGYMKIARNKDSQCGISLRNYYPIIA